MKRLTKEQVLLLHSQLIQEFGGSDGLREEGLLESALSSPFQSFGGEDLYPSIQAKAAQLGYGLIKITHFSMETNELGPMSCWFSFSERN